MAKTCRHEAPVPPDRVGGQTGPPDPVPRPHTRRVEMPFSYAAGAGARLSDLFWKLRRRAHQLRQHRARGCRPARAGHHRPSGRCRPHCCAPARHGRHRPHPDPCAPSRRHEAAPMRVRVPFPNGAGGAAWDAAARYRPADWRTCQGPLALFRAVPDLTVSHCPRCAIRGPATDSPPVRITHIFRWGNSNSLVHRIKALRSIRVSAVSRCLIKVRKKPLGDLALSGGLAVYAGQGLNTARAGGGDPGLTMLNCQPQAAHWGIG